MGLRIILLNPLKTKRVCIIEGVSPYRAVNTLHLGYKNQSVNVVYREIIAVCSEIRTKHIHSLCGQNVEFLSFEPGST
jgi:hypothetical protein